MFQGCTRVQSKNCFAGIQMNAPFSDFDSLRLMESNIECWDLAKLVEYDDRTPKLLTQQP